MVSALRKAGGIFLRVENAEAGSRKTAMRAMRDRGFPERRNNIYL